MGEKVIQALDEKELIAEGFISDIAMLSARSVPALVDLLVRELTHSVADAIIKKHITSVTLHESTYTAEKKISLSVYVLSADEVSALVNAAKEEARMELEAEMAELKKKVQSRKPLKAQRKRCARGDKYTPPERMNELHLDIEL